MSTQPIYAMLDTWTGGTTTWKAISMNVTDAASASDSKLIDLLISSVSKFSVDKNGNLVLAGTGRFEGILSADGLELDNDLAIAHGGTGASTAGAALNNLGALARSNGEATGLKLLGTVAYSILETGLAYIHSAAQHIAMYKKAGAFAFYWRKSDDGTSTGANQVELMTLTDAGELYVAGGKVIHTGNDGAGSTLDADLLDGLHAASFLRADIGDTINSGAAPQALALNSNANTNLALMIGGARKGYLLASGNNIQLAADDGIVNIAGTALTFNGNPVWNSANDGAASGLDADLLDGQEGAAYLRNNALNPKSTHLSLGTGASIASLPVSLGALEVQSEGSGGAAAPAVLCLHRVGGFATYLGIDIDNRLKLGGWSMGANAYDVWNDSTAARSLLDNGYQRFPNGLIVQWGTSPAGAADRTVAFPTVFPNLCLNVQATADSDSAAVFAMANQKNAANFVVRGRDHTGAGVSIPIYWMAWGY